MSTWRYSINPEDAVESIVAATGVATVTKHIELTIDLANLITDGGVSRPIKRSELIQAMRKIEEAIIKDPALL
jgi:hypothetical protein